MPDAGQQAGKTGGGGNAGGLHIAQRSSCPCPHQPLITRRLEGPIRPKE
jgi:hypothetical protein